MLKQTSIFPTDGKWARLAVEDVTLSDSAGNYKSAAEGGGQATYRAALGQSDRAQVESLQKVRKMFQFAFSGMAVGMAWREDGGPQPGGREPIRNHQEIKGPRGRGSPNGTVMKIEFSPCV